ncbi:hypothetical protein ACTNNG_004614 [Vibrio parahaemolyticus]|nr:hypothetical protein [Vibrio parahaemolyticus]ELA8147361.1 hypothetical protein [Vibrio parahaemolyticus]ELA8182354.1 hypothetical protein [Vibrio parahaemolyticus]ELB2733052.1 hypothetical protein [Vibrio parahaemolyticus]
MAADKHSCFEAPANVETKIWRYMDFTKFISLLNSSSLFLSRVDKFEDPYEGSTSHFNLAARPHVYADSKIPPKTMEQLGKFNRWSREWTYVNCWHLNDHESAAMWKLYAQTSEAVAIQSRFSVLEKLLPEKTYVGQVKYIDYDRDWLPEGNGFWPFVHKRKSFEHERELRVLAQELPVHEGEGKGFDYSTRNPLFGKSVEIDLAQLIEAVYIAPDAPSWFLELVKGSISRYGYDFQVIQSDLARKPVF